MITTQHDYFALINQFVSHKIFVSLYSCVYTYHFDLCKHYFDLLFFVHVHICSLINGWISVYPKAYSVF